jgi:hypothetical protein
MKDWNGRVSLCSSGAAKLTDRKATIARRSMEPTHRILFTRKKERRERNIHLQGLFQTKKPVGENQS